MPFSTVRTIPTRCCTNWGILEKDSSCKRPSNQNHPPMAIASMMMRRRKNFIELTHSSPCRTYSRRNHLLSPGIPESSRARYPNARGEMTHSAYGASHPAASPHRAPHGTTRGERYTHHRLHTEAGEAQNTHPLAV